MYNLRFMSQKERMLITRQQIKYCIRLKKQNNNISCRELSTKLSLTPSTARMVFGAADAWIKREQIATLIDQLNTGNLDGLKPLASLDEYRSGWP